MKQHAKEKTVPPPRKDDRMTGKESFLSALLGVAINVMAMVFAGVFFMKGTGPQRAEPPALKICIKKLLPKGNQSSDKRTIKRSKDLQR